MTGKQVNKIGTRLEPEDIEKIIERKGKMSIITLSEKGHKKLDKQGE
jgi:predicted RNA-binding protein YlqC (UPF0109 family)